MYHFIQSFSWERYKQSRYITCDAIADRFRFWRLAAGAIAVNNRRFLGHPPNSTTSQPSQQRSQLSSGFRLDAQDTTVSLEHSWHGICSCAVRITLTMSQISSTLLALIAILPSSPSSPVLAAATEAVAAFFVGAPAAASWDGATNSSLIHQGKEYNNDKEENE